MSTNIEDLESLLWKDALDSLSQDYPAKRPLVAHYTSLDTLEKILDKSEIWLSNPLFMNDHSELSFGVLEGINAFLGSPTLEQASLSKNNYVTLRNKINTAFKNFDEHFVPNIYIFCSTEHSNDNGALSMWRGYGSNGNGAALVLNTEKFTVPQEGSPLIFGKVKSLTLTEQRNWIKGRIYEVESFLSQQAKITEEILNRVVNIWLLRLVIFSLFTKHPGFHEEQEWRAVYLSELDKTNIFKPMLSYSITNRGIEPKLKLDINKMNQSLGSSLTLEDLIDKIILGPCVSKPLAIHAMHRMLENVKKPSLRDKIITSDIPYRS